jgi:chaperonin GroES
MKPVRNQIVFKPFPPDEVSEGGIFVPESARKESNRGVIVEVGNGTSHKKMTLKAGQIAYRVKDWGTPIDVNGERCYLMEDAAILATE